MPDWLLGWFAAALKQNTVHSLGSFLKPPRCKDVDLQLRRTDLLLQHYRKWLKAGFNNSIFPSVIPSSSLLCSAKGQILTDYATAKQQWGHLRDYSTVRCGLRHHYFSKWAKTTEGLLMKLLESINPGPMKFQAWPLKASPLNILMSDVWRLTIRRLGNHVNDISDLVDPMAPSDQHYVDWKGADKQLMVSDLFHISGDQK